MLSPFFHYISEEKKMHLKNTVITMENCFQLNESRTTTNEYIYI